MSRTNHSTDSSVCDCGSQIQEPVCGGRSEGRGMQLISGCVCRWRWRRVQENRSRRWSRVLTVFIKENPGGVDLVTLMY